MSGIRETRKKLQRSVLYLVKCEKAESALHELTLLKQTVDSQIELLSRKLNLMEESDDAPDTQQDCQSEESAVAQAAKHGYNAIYGEEEAGQLRGLRRQRIGQQRG